MNMATDTRKSPAVPARSIGNIVLRVDAYNNEFVSDDCHPGAISGTVMGGPLHDKSITVRTRITPTNARVPTVADLQDESRMVQTPPGGYLALEGVRQEGGRFTTRWINKMGDPGSDLRVGIPVQISPSMNADGSVRRFRSNGATIYNGFMMHARDAEPTTELATLRASMAAAVGDKGAAALAVVLTSEQGISRKTLSVLRGWNGSEPATVDEAVERFFERNSETRMRQVFESGGVVDVIPMEVARVGSRVAEAMDLGGRSEIALGSYMTGGLGARLEGALRRMDPAESSSIEGAFLAQAHPNAKSAFAAVGWKGVWNRDIERFFGSLNISLPRVPRYGFAVTTAALKPYGGEPGSGSFIAKARTLSVPVPRDAVPTLSDPNAVARFYGSINQAVRNSLELLPDQPAIGKPQKIALEPDRENANNRRPGSENAGKTDGVFRDIKDRTEPEIGEQMDF